MVTESHDPSIWRKYQPSEEAPWDRRRVVHLHRRAAFAATSEMIERDLADGPQAAIDRLLQGKSRLGRLPGEFEKLADTIGSAAEASGSNDRLRAWWCFRMLLSPDPLTERLTLLWHNHFATSIRKVQDLVLMRQQIELFRRHARAPFGRLLAAVLKHPAMLVWLDADSNRAGHPNENLGRELLELFTLGIGNYSEADVQAASQALTGWTIGEKAFRFVPERHDDSELKLLGRCQRFDGDELLTVLVNHPATARRLAWRLSTLFFGEDAISEAALDALANGLRERDLSVAWAVETMLRSELFFGKANLGTRVLGPVEFVMGSLHAFDLCQPPPSTLMLAEWVSRMGQELFAPPNVGGWPEGRSWLGARGVVARSNFAADLVAGNIWTVPSPPDFSRKLDIDVTDQDVDSTVARLAHLWWGSPATAAELFDSVSTDTLINPLPRTIVALLSHPAAQLG